jgi:hypothetical protein
VFAEQLALVATMIEHNAFPLEAIVRTVEELL